MKKNRVRSAFGLFVLIAFATAIHAQWVPTTLLTGDDSKINFVRPFVSQSKVFVHTWDSLYGHQLYLTDNAGTNWTQIGSTNNNIDILSAVSVNSTTLLAGTFSGLYQSTNNGTSWTDFNPTGIPTDTVIWSLTKINDTIFAGAMGDIYFSKDNGTTWTDVKSGLPTSPSRLRINSVIRCGNAVFAGSDSDGVFKSTDGPATWTAFSTGLDSVSRHINQLMALGSKLFAVTLKGVYTSTLNSTGWTALSSLTDVNCLAVANKKLYAGTDTSGVYVSTDSGATWTAFNSGMPARTRVWALAVSSDNIFAGTNAGVRRYPISTGTGQDLSERPSSISPGLHFMRQNGARATIEFSLAAPACVDLALYDMSGNKTASLVHKGFVAGVHRFSFAAGSISPGSYIVRMTTGTGVYQKAVQLLR